MPSPHLPTVTNPRPKHERLRQRPASAWEDTLRVIEATSDMASGPRGFEAPSVGERERRPPPDPLEAG